MTSPQPAPMPTFLAPADAPAPVVMPEVPAAVNGQPRPAPAPPTPPAPRPEPTAEEEPGAPQPLFRFDGKFAVYLAPDDAIVIAYATRQDDGTFGPAGRHILPPMLLATAAMVSGQKPGEMLAKLKEMFG